MGSMSGPLIVEFCASLGQAIFALSVLQNLVLLPSPEILSIYNPLSAPLVFTPLSHFLPISSTHHFLLFSLKGPIHSKFAVFECFYLLGFAIGSSFGSSNQFPRKIFLV